VQIDRKVWGNDTKYLLLLFEMNALVFSLILLSTFSGASALRFVSKEAERAYFASLESSDTSFSLKQANISAFLSAGAYCNKNDYSTMKFKGPAEGFQLFHTIFDSKTDTQGFIGVLDSDKSIYVAYRGSSTISNWIVNIDAVKTDYTSFPDCHCQVHKVSMGHKLRDTVGFHVIISIICTFMCCFNI
jgi:hypothetical protein